MYVAQAFDRAIERAARGKRYCQASRGSAVISGSGAAFQLKLLGTFRLVAPDGQRIEISSKRGIALLAMLAMAREGECTRVWLQDKLWSRAQKSQSQASLRRELSNLRKGLGAYADDLLETDHQLVRLNIEHIAIDARNGCAGAATNGEFLEGLDIAGEEGFEDWLRDQRRHADVDGEAPTASGVLLDDPATSQATVIVSVGVVGGNPRDVFQAEIAAITEEHGGWIFRADAGGTIVACATADQALALVGAVRRHSAALATESGDDEIMRLRFGVSIANVQQDGDLRQGRAVDIAVGLQQAARTGGVMVAAAVHDALSDKTPLHVAGHGQMEVAETVLPVMSLQFADAASAARLPRHILDVDQPTPGFDNRPALAVLPLKNLTAGDTWEYIAEGISEELINRLSRLRWLPVIARSSSFSFDEKTTGIEEIGARLGAKYVLEGHLRDVDQVCLITIRLSDAGSGRTLSSHRLELPRDHSQAAIDALAAELVAALDARIDRAEQLRAREVKPGQQGVNDLIWQGRWHLNRLTREDSQAARELFDQALALEPDSPEALIQATLRLTWSIWAGRESQSKVDELRRLAQKAILADVDDGRGHMLAGVAEIWLRQPVRARALMQQAIALNPSLAMAHAQLGGSYNLSGEPELALAPLTTGMRLSPNDVHIFYSLGEMAMANNLLGNWASAVEHADQALIRRPAYWYAHMIKITALARSGDIAAAGFAYDELMEMKPDFSPKYIQWLPFLDSKWNNFFVEGLALVPSERSNKFQQDSSDI